MFKNVFWREDEGRGKKSVKTQAPEIDEEEEYDPFAHRDVPKPTSDFGALAHLLKTSLGSGILAMPMAFKYAGLILGTFGTILIGVLCAHSVQMLIWNSQYLCKKLKVPVLTFSETAEAAFRDGPRGFRKCARTIGITITVELIASFIMGNSVYVVLMSHTIYQVFDFYIKPDIDIRIYTVALWIPLTLMCMLPNLKSLVPFSTLANIFVLVSFGITLYYIFRDMSTNSPVVMISHIETWPLFLCTVIFAVEGIGTVLSIENEMKNPGRFIGGRCSILAIAMSIVITVYTLVGFFGYLEYGSNTKGSITLNLPITEAMAQVVKVLIGLAIFFTYALQFYVPINLITNMINKRLPVKYHKTTKLCVRIGLVSITIIISIVIPHLEPFISLVGAISFSTLGLLFPSLIDTVVRHPDYGFLKWRLWKNIFIIIVSIVALVSGAYMSVWHIILTYIRDYAHRQH